MDAVVATVADLRTAVYFAVPQLDVVLLDLEDRVEVRIFPFLSFPSPFSLLRLMDIFLIGRSCERTSQTTGPTTRGMMMRLRVKARG